MGFGEQVETLKKSWLLIVLILFLFLSFAFFLVFSVGSFSYGTESLSASFDMTDGSRDVSGFSNLAPEVVERIIVKTASLRLEVVNFNHTQSRLENLIDEHNVIKSSENINTVNRRYVRARYTLNVPTEEYDVFVNELQTFGVVLSFNERSQDITGSYLNNRDIIELEKEVLEAYERLYDSTTSTSERTNLIRRISDQKSRIRSLENRMANQDDRLDYSQVTLNIDERTPRHANVQFATFSDLWSGVKASTNVLIWLVTYLIPFIIFGTIIFYLKRIIKNRFSGN